MKGVGDEEAIAFVTKKEDEPASIQARSPPYECVTWRSAKKNPTLTRTLPRGGDRKHKKPTLVSPTSPSFPAKFRLAS
ncbi:hypothetical protein [Oscillatoria acuminata]|uniref:hypothetical protein n=1 Tax=Oscillatoria acuminata TaxID=118323 RepID=UPI0003035A37|nr:hypothetical protein [Oscillatoria acuminata]